MPGSSCIQEVRTSHPSKRGTAWRFQMVVKIGAWGKISCSAQSTRSAPPFCSSRSWTSAMRSGRNMLGSLAATPRGFSGGEPFLVGLAGDPDPGGRPVEDATAPDHHPAELADRAEQPAAAWGASLKSSLSLQRRVVVDLVPVGPEGRIAVMQHRSLKTTDRSVDADGFVHRPLIKSRPVPTEETDVAGISRRPAVVAQRPAHEVGWHEQPVGIEPRGSELPLDLRRQLRGHDLVGIDIQDPVGGGLPDAKVLLGPITRPGPTRDPGAHRLG